ncbi:MFS transporter [Bartonella sp. LJL80]
MPSISSKPTRNTPSRIGQWGPVFALSLCVFILIAAEFMPISLLTPIAHEFAISEGQAGHMIAVTGTVAVFTSLVIGTIIHTIDRKFVLIILSTLTLVSCSLVACASNFAMMIAGRATLGIALGGFWTISAATTMRLVPVQYVPRALAVLNGGNALATVIAPAFGSYIGDLLGWRFAFLSLVPLAVAALLWQIMSLPSLPSDNSVRSRMPLILLKEKSVRYGFIAVFLFFMGQFCLFTYLRPFLENIDHVDTTNLSLILFSIGISGFSGTVWIGFMGNKKLGLMLMIAPAILAFVAIALSLFGNQMAISWALLLLWGFIATSAPVAWWAWLARRLPNNAETGGGLMVATIQLAITVGALLGGYLYDYQGYQTTFVVSACILLLSMFVARIIKQQ